MIICDPQLDLKSLNRRHCDQTRLRNRNLTDYWCLRTIKLISISNEVIFLLVKRYSAMPLFRQLLYDTYLLELVHVLQRPNP